MSRSRFGLYLGRVFGIRFYLDYSWFFVAILTVWVLGTLFFPQALREPANAVHLLMGFVAAVLFFLSILLHELGHSLVSQRCGIPVPRITLLFIGGIAEISREPDNPRDELKIALGGPAASLVLVLIYGLISFAFGAADLYRPALVFSWLAGANLMLIIFNAVPGYPLDGGRVLRALLWARSGNLRRSTYITTRIGVAFSWVLIVLGAWFCLQGQLNMLVLLLIGIFLKGAAESGYMHTVYQEVLADVRVADIMSRDPLCIPPGMPVNLAVDEYFLANHHVAFPVCDPDREFRGLLRFEFLTELPREKWPFTSVGSVVAGHGSPDLSIQASETALRAMRRLLTPGQSRLAVLEGKKVVGMVTRHDVLQFIKIHSELEA